jgi:hypothetical protein
VFQLAAIDDIRGFLGCRVVVQSYRLRQTLGLIVPPMLLVVPSMLLARADEVIE